MFSLSLLSDYAAEVKNIHQLAFAVYVSSDLELISNEYKSENLTTDAFALIDGTDYIYTPSALPGVTPPPFPTCP